MLLKIVVDTNILVSALVKKGSAPDRLVRRWLAEDFVIVTCPAALAEVTDVLNRPTIRVKYRILDQDIDEFLHRFAHQTQIVPGTTVTGIVPDDPKDDMFISVAVEGEARYLISGDQHVLDLKHYQGIRIMSVARFLALLNRLERWQFIQSNPTQGNE